MKENVVRGVAIIFGWAVIHLVDKVTPWTLPTGVPQWVTIIVYLAGWGWSTWLTHSALRRFLDIFSGK